MLNPGDCGFGAVTSLLSSVPDCLFIEGSTARIVYPATITEPCYSYCVPGVEPVSHFIFKGAYQQQVIPFNHYQITGEKEKTGEILTAHAFDWQSIVLTGERLKIIHDLAVRTQEEADAKAEIMLANAQAELLFGQIRVPLNAGAQLWDVVEITDPALNLIRQKAIVIGIKTVYQPSVSRYEQEIALGNI